jgi:transposase
MPITKLSKQSVEEIYVELREGTQMKEIAPMFGVSRTLISKVNVGALWKNPYMTYPIRREK